MSAASAIGGHAAISPNHGGLIGRPWRGMESEGFVVVVVDVRCCGCVVGTLCRFFSSSYVGRYLEVSTYLGGVPAIIHNQVLVPIARLRKYDVTPLICGSDIPR